jgi:hypothetical protein
MHPRPRDQKRYAAEMSKGGKPDSAGYQVKRVHWVGPCRSFVTPESTNYDTHAAGKATRNADRVPAST